MQLLTADNEQNAVHFTSELYKNNHVAEKSKAANKKRCKGKECIKE